MSDSVELQILQSWSCNAKPWIRAIANAEITSRVLATNAAIVAAIQDRQPASVLDVGCGDGWLVRELSRLNIDALGVDAVPELVD